MPNVYKPYLIQIRPQYSDAGDNTPENILWFIGSVPSGYSSLQLREIQAAFDEGWLALWQVIGAEGSHYLGSVVIDWTSDAGLEVPVASAGGGAGSAGNPIGVNTAALISREIGIRWRGGHPRTYLPALGVNCTTNGSQLNTGDVAGLVTAYGTFLSGMGSISGPNGGPCTEQVYRFRNEPTKAQLYDITAYIVNAELASQRRRLRRVSRK